MPPVLVVVQGFILLMAYSEHMQRAPFSFDIVLYHKHEEIRGDITNAFINCSPSVYYPFLYVFFQSYSYLCICVYEHMHAGVVSCHKMMSDLWKVELQVAVSCWVWVLGTELGPLQEQGTRLLAEPSLQCCVFGV